MTEGLSDYEKIRLDNIKRNEEFLRSLGLDSVKLDIVDETHHAGTGYIKSCSTRPKGNSKKRFAKSRVEETGTLRRSRRSAPTNVPIIDDDSKDYYQLAPLPLPISSNCRYDESDNDNPIMIDDALQRNRITAPLLREHMIFSNPAHAAIFKNSVSYSDILYNFILFHHPDRPII